jgi:hypothetical protein
MNEHGVIIKHTSVFCQYPSVIFSTTQANSVEFVLISLYSPLTAFQKLESLPAILHALDLLACSPTGGNITLISTFSMFSYSLIELRLCIK